MRCRYCGAEIVRTHLNPEAAQWRGGRATIYVDKYGSAKMTGLVGHYHEPEDRNWKDVRAEAVESGKINEYAVARLRDGQWRLAKLIEEDEEDTECTCQSPYRCGVHDGMWP